MVPEHKDQDPVRGLDLTDGIHIDVRAVRSIWIIMCFIGLVAGCGGQADSLPENWGEPQTLFNGHDLQGWEVHGTELWYVEEGDLVCESGRDAEYGYLATEKTFHDFDLTLEFKQEADGNSGVFFRSNLDGIIIDGWQTEVAPPGLFTGGIYESYGRGWLIQPQSDQPDVRMGDWNLLRIRAVADTVTTWLNGVEMIRLVDAEIGEGEGVIALQIHDGGGIKVRWRNIRVVDLNR